MKNISFTGTIVLMLVVVSSFTAIDDFKVNKKILGEWEYNVPQAGYEYQKGVFVFSKEGKELKGEVLIGNQSMPMESVVNQKNNVKAKINVQGEGVSLDLNFEETTFKGTVTYSEGTMEISGSKKE
jgi:hypothetical protein